MEEMTTYGYAGKILRVDLTSTAVEIMSTSEYAGRFLGGRGMAAKIYWDEVPPYIDAFHPDNRLLFATGPVGGVPVLGGSRLQVCGKSPEAFPHRFSYCNLGGRWAGELKFAGFDAIVVHGCSEKPVYLYVNQGNVELRDATALWGKGTFETREVLKAELGDSVRVLTIGPAGESRVVGASLLADNDASGSAGMGAVMGSKALKAIAVKGSPGKVAIARPDKMREVVEQFRRLRKDPHSVPMWGREWIVTGKKDPCYGCTGYCVRRVYTDEEGKSSKFACQAENWYQLPAARHYRKQTEVPFHATWLCNYYGLDTWFVESITSWLNRCYRAGLMSDEETGIPISSVGSREFIEILTRKIAFREGFGDILARGLVDAAEITGAKTKELIPGYPNLQGMEEGYEPRLYITTGLLHATEPRTPVAACHEICFPLGRWMNWAKGLESGYLSSQALRTMAEKFWGSQIAADFSTCEGKALAAAVIQDREYAKESMVLCDWLWPTTDVDHTDDHMGDPTLESKVVSAITGQDIDEEGLYRIGERVFNMQRAVLVREGHLGREFDRLPDNWHSVPLPTNSINRDCLVPGRDGEIISRRGEVVDREAFEKMKDEYYQIRRWDVATGLQTFEQMSGLGLADIAQELDKLGLLANREHRR